MGRPSGTGRDLYMDLESDNLLKDMTVVHCLAVIDMNSDEEFYFGPAVPEGHPKWTPLLGNPSGTLEDGYAMMEEANYLVAHNGIDFDYLAVEKVHPTWKRPALAWDSLVMAKVVWPYDTLIGPDMGRAAKGLLPKHLIKRHSLEAWGYRLGTHKDEYDGDRTKYPEPRDRPARKGDERYDRRWEEWNPWLASYMMQDCRPGVLLWRLIKERIGWTEKATAVTWPHLTMEVENETARIIRQQELDGCRFDLPKARLLEAELLNEEARLKAVLEDAFGSWWQPGKETLPASTRRMKREDLPYITRPRISEKTGKRLADYHGPVTETYTEGVPYTPIERVKFSSSSRDHLGQRLQAVFGWKPKKFGQNGKPTVDETVLEEIPEAIIPKDLRQSIMDFFVVAKTLGTLARGQRSWINMCVKHGDGLRIHGQMDSAGAITGRGTHKNPNLSGVPKLLKEKVPGGGEIMLRGLRGRYGYECRELFTADDGWEFTDVDATGLELIDLGHYLWPHDDGVFSARVSDPNRDPHQENADLADMTRNDAKTAIYLFVYGGGAYKLSLALTVEEHEVLEYLSYRGLPMLLKHLVTRFDQDFVDKLDDNQKARIAKARIIITKFEKNIDGLRALIDAVTEAAGKGWLRGLDGRKLTVRKAYSALNTLLQSAGAQTCKLWLVLLERALIAKGLVRGRDFKQVLWVHDALSFTHKPGLGPLIRETAQATLKEAGVVLGLRGEYRGAGNTGANWAEVH